MESSKRLEERYVRLIDVGLNFNFLLAHDESSSPMGLSSVNMVKGLSCMHVSFHIIFCLQVHVFFDCVVHTGGFC